jgi:uncharacterized OB-fold protein
MTPEEKKAFQDKIHAFVGMEMAPPTKGPDDVNKAMIRHWCEVMGDANPVYTDEAFAKASSKGGIIAPPAMLQAWSLEGYPMHSPSKDEALLDNQRKLHKVFDDHGYTGVLGTNCTQEYFRDLKPGDQVVSHTVIDSISEEKATQRGIGHFIETVTTFTDQNGDKIGAMRFRVLKFIPNESNTTETAKDDGKPEVPHRIHSPRGHDNKWWWEQVDKGVMPIQRCKNCQTLRHPPRSMCGECQSIEWDFIESKLDGEVFSFVEMHYPKFPGYQYPLICAVISLSEGARVVSNIVGCKPEDVFIGMKVKGKVEQVDEKTMLPQFYPA